MENTITNIAKGVGIALLASLILLLVFAIVLTYTNVSAHKEGQFSSLKMTILCI